MSKRRQLACNIDPAELYAKTKYSLNNKYYDLFRSQIEWEGIDYRQERFIMNQFWSGGEIAAFNIKGADELGFAPFAVAEWDMYNCPEVVNLVNLRGSPLIPTKPQIVDKDVVLGRIQASGKSVKSIVDVYIEQLAQIAMVINTNLQLQRMPFVFTVEDDKMRDKVADIMDRIFSGEVGIISDVDPNTFKAIVTQAPYVIDKLRNYYKDLEDDLKTFLGIDNNGVNKIEQLQLSEINANNAEIEGHQRGFLGCLQDFCERVKDVLGKSLSVKSKAPKMEDDGVKKTYEDVPGPMPKEDSENE